MDELLRNGADPFLVDKAQLRTALHYCAAFGQEAALGVLLSDSTRVDTEEGRVALRQAKIRDMSGICRLLLSTKPLPISPHPISAT